MPRFLNWKLKIRFKARPIPCWVTWSPNKFSTHHVTMKQHLHASLVITSTPWNAIKILNAQFFQTLWVDTMKSWMATWTWWPPRSHHWLCCKVLDHQILKLVLAMMEAWNCNSMVMLLLWSWFLLSRLLSVLVFAAIQTCKLEMLRKKQWNNKLNSINSSISFTNKWLMRKPL